MNSRKGEVAKEYADDGMWNIGEGKNGVETSWGLWRLIYVFWYDQGVRARTTERQETQSTASETASKASVSKDSKVSLARA